jgi:Ser/Thr protein kinase RdoA (MazF antagonist)
MSLRAQALQEFELPAAPQRIDELSAFAPGTDACKVYAPAGRFLLIQTAGALALAFEATLFDLLAESRYPSPRPRRARGGSLIAMLDGRAAAACYSVPAGEELAPAAASAPQLMEVGRLLARLHHLGETHPASVADCLDFRALLSRMQPGKERDRLEPIATAGLPPLPSGAVHGGVRPTCALFIGERCSAVLPSAMSCSAALVLDLAETAAGWMVQAARPLAALRALASGYQAMRKLVQEEKEALPAALRFASAREAARKCVMGRPEPMAALDCVERLAESDLIAAAG